MGGDVAKATDAGKAVTCADVGAVRSATAAEGANGAAEADAVALAVPSDATPEMASG